MGSKITPEHFFSMARALELFVERAPYDIRKKLTVADVRSAFAAYPGLVALPANRHAIRYVMRTMGTTKRGKNMRANVRAMMDFVVPLVPATERAERMSEEWAQLVTGSVEDKPAFFMLQRFARHCTSKGVAPHEVSDVILVAFVAHVEALGTLTNTRKYHSRLAAVWNHASLAVPGWPSVRLSPPPPLNPAEKKTPALDELSSSIADQLIACEKVLLLFSEQVGSTSTVISRKKARDYKKRRLKRTTIESYMKYIRRATKMAAKIYEVPIDKFILSALRDPELAEHILLELQAELTAGGKGVNALHLMACALRRVAETVFNVSGDDLQQFVNLVGNIVLPEPTMTEKNARRLRSLVLRKRHELVRLPAKLMASTLQAIRQGKCNSRHLADAQVAVAIAIVLSLPIRESNLAAIRFGAHLELPKEAGTEGWIRTAAGETKNDVAIDRPVPVDVAEVIRTYRTKVLPLIRSNPESDALFPGRFDNSTRGPVALGVQISKRIHMHLGIDMHLHLFRHFAALVYLEENPGEYEVVRILLGNRNLEIIKNIYSGLEKQATLRKAHTAMAKLKRDAGLSPTNMLIDNSKKTAGRVRRGPSPTA